MNKEAIETAADKYAESATPSNCHGDFDFIAIAEAFERGARWRINVAWHDTSKIPDPWKYCLVELKDGDGNVCIRVDWRSEYEWVNACHYDEILRWAYIDDLLPEGKEGRP